MVDHVECKKHELKYVGASSSVYGFMCKWCSYECFVDRRMLGRRLTNNIGNYRKGYGLSTENHQGNTYFQQIRKDFWKNRRVITADPNRFYPHGLTFTQDPDAVKMGEWTDTLEAKNYLNFIGSKDFHGRINELSESINRRSQ